MPRLILFIFSRWLTAAAGEFTVNSTLKPDAPGPTRSTSASQAATSVKVVSTRTRAAGTPASARLSATSAGTQTAAAPLLSHWMAAPTSQTCAGGRQRSK